MKNILLMGLLTVTATTVQAAEFNDIVKTCTTITLEKSSVSAVCTAENGGKYKTSLRLRGVNNHNGVFVVEDNTSVPSVFHQTCQNTSIDSRAVLAGKCKDDDNNYIWTTIDLKPLLKNYNGTLVYPLSEDN